MKISGTMCVLSLIYSYVVFFYVGYCIVCCLIVIGCFLSFARFVFDVFDCSLDVCFLVLYVFFFSVLCVLYVVSPLV